MAFPFLHLLATFYDFILLHVLILYCTHHLLAVTEASTVRVGCAGRCQERVPAQVGIYLFLIFIEFLHEFWGPTRAKPSPLLLSNRGESAPRDCMIPTVEVVGVWFLVFSDGHHSDGRAGPATSCIALAIWIYCFRFSLMHHGPPHEDCQPQGTSFLTLSAMLSGSPPPPPGFSFHLPLGSKQDDQSAVSPGPLCRGLQAA